MVDLQKLYWEERKSISDIAKELGTSTFTVRKQMIREKIPRRERKKAQREKKLIKPILSLSSTLSYLVACILGDGFVGTIQNHSTEGRITLGAIDKEFVDAFNSSLKSIGLHPSRGEIYNNGKIYFKTLAYSLTFSNWYKTLSEEDIEEIAFAYPKEFLRGIYDSEGYFYCGWIRRKGSLKSEFRCGIFISNTKKWLIDLIYKLSAYLGFKFRLQKRCPKEENRKVLYNLFLSNRNKVLSFLKEIEPTISRKSIDKYYNVMNEGRNLKQIPLSI